MELNLPQNLFILADSNLTFSEWYATEKHKIKVFQIKPKQQKCGNFETTNKELAETWRIVFATDAVEFWLTYDPKNGLFTKL